MRAARIPWGMGEYTNKAMGKTKKAVGRATGDRDLERRGRTQEGAGKVQGGVRKAGRKVNATIDKVGDKMASKRRARPATGRPATRTRTTTKTETVERY